MIGRRTWAALLLLSAPVAGNLLGQDLDKAERLGSELERVVVEERRSLDSLSRMLESNARRIEDEKKKKAPNLNQLSQWMSDGVWLAGRVKHQKSRVERMEQDWLTLQKRLHEYYTDRIDSLTRINRANLSKDQAKDVERQIWEYTQKRILYSPAVRTLSFDPRLINSMTLSHLDDSLERAIQLDYLAKAHAEVTVRLDEVRQKRREYASMLRLQQKLETFVEEIGEQSYLPLSRRTGTPVPPGFVPIDERYWNNQMHSLVNLLQQLYVRGSSTGPRTIALNGTATVEEYVSLLEETEKQLADYQRFIKNKMP